ncbi:hypothetical protein M1349_00150 [Patescibacteria group bacterium]|nr:hypothetical protein [Patescibacteria group bacterium]
MSAETQSVTLAKIQPEESIHDRLIRLDKDFGSSKPGAFCSSPKDIDRIIREVSRETASPFFKKP